MSHLNRRNFLAATAATAAGVTGALARNSWADAPKPGPHKAMIGVPSEALLREWKEAGFEGMESTDRGASPAKAAAVRKMAEKLGMRIHSVMYGWANFNHPASVAGDLASVETALKAAAAYGADTVLLVPCRIGGKMPEAWEFDIRFDPASGHLKQVVSGDNGPYTDYIATHDRSVDASREAVKRLIPAAEKAGVIIALENVWNNMWVLPDFFQNFVASFDSPWVRAYFDIGNHVKYCAAAEMDPHARQADCQVPREGLQAEPQWPRRRVLQHPRRQHRLAGRAQGPGRDRLPRLDVDRRG